VAADAERLARFKREAQLLAALSHPNIAAIFGLEQIDGAPYLALELVEGEDLSARIEARAVAPDDAIEIALQIAAALGEAHAKGIVHRDLKPGNIKVTADGKVKVLDFGLAKALSADAAANEGALDLSRSPTMTAALGTQAGLILGTAGYTAPEQARGKGVDRRADIWAFGVMLFEMLTGARLFTGETVTDVIAAVVTREPDWSLLPANTPAATRRLLRRCHPDSPSAVDKSGLYVGSLDGGEPRLLHTARSRAVYTDGSLLFVDDGILMARAFDLESRSFQGEPVSLAEGVTQSVDALWGGALFSVSDQGTLLFVRGAPERRSPSQLRWRDREGHDLGTFGDPQPFNSVKLAVPVPGPGGGRRSRVRVGYTGPGMASVAGLSDRHHGNREERGTRPDRRRRLRGERPSRQRRIETPWTTTAPHGSQTPPRHLTGSAATACCASSAKAEWGRSSKPSRRRPSGGGSP